MTIEIQASVSGLMFQHGGKYVARDSQPVLVLDVAKARPLDFIGRKVHGSNERDFFLAVPAGNKT